MEGIHDGNVSCPARVKISKIVGNHARYNLSQIRVRPDSSVGPQVFFDHNVADQVAEFEVPVGRPFAEALLGSP
jgi:hypothetical protein